MGDTQESPAHEAAEGVEHVHTATELAEAASGGAEGAEAAGAAGAEVAGAEVAGEGAAAIGGGAVLGAAAGVGLAAYGGYQIGEAIENQTHAGTAAGDAAFNASDPNDAHAAAVHFDDAGEDWNRGNYGSAVGDAAEGVGSMIEGLWHGNPNPDQNSQ